jgi:hypothetical protein
MDSPSIVVGGLVSVAESIDRGRFSVGEPSVTSQTRRSKDSTDYALVSRRPMSIAQLPNVQSTNLQPSHVQPSREQPAGNGACTLRVKPDRRRTQVPVPHGTDRRRRR